MDKDIFSLNNKIVIITGGLGQLGLQFSSALINSGAKVAIFDMNLPDNILNNEIEEKLKGGSLIILQVDVTQKNSIKRGMKEVIAKWGVPHGLINNAALDSPPDAPIEENGPFEHYPESSWDKVIEVNQKGVYLSCQIIGGEMSRAGRGSIINISSIYGILSPDQRIYEYRRKEQGAFYKPVAYSVSKSAILNLTRYLATYWAKNNVRVNTLTFGGVFNKQDEKFLEAYCSRVPMGRMAREDEYNGSVIFLISNASSYMTGSNIVIDGGWSAW